MIITEDRCNISTLQTWLDDDDDDDEDRKRPNRIVAKAERKKQKSETARENSRNWFGQMGKGCRNLNEDLLRGNEKREEEGRQGSGTS